MDTEVSVDLIAVVVSAVIVIVWLIRQEGRINLLFEKVAVLDDDMKTATAAIVEVQQTLSEIKGRCDSILSHVRKE